MSRKLIVPQAWHLFAKTGVTCWLKPPRLFVKYYKFCNFSKYGCTMATSAPTFSNRLAQEKSPYLLQHANNPVNWYPWGEEAFTKAREENKPIFLSVGYSTCHWCHVMERESFENEEIGKFLNDNFVSIKVDREERPDVDRVYMNFVQAITGGGGWPMSVWLTPDLKPLVGGTYFPPEDRYYGQPGFLSMLKKIASTWESNKNDLETQGQRILDSLKEHTQLAGASGDAAMPNPTEAKEKCYMLLNKNYDPVKGGFGKAPKFPQPVNLNFLLRYYSENKDTEEGDKALKIVVHTLKMMDKGGIHDHISKGFHRYSTDDNWHVPHFEKMLYDQGQLAVSYAEAYQITREECFADTVEDILSYVEKDLSHPEGGFFSAEDADSLPKPGSKKKKEGAFCVWTHDEVKHLLSEKVDSAQSATLADVFCYYYGVKPEGNVDPYQDPHNELTDQNVLIITNSIEATAEKFGLSPAQVVLGLDKAKEVLHNVRKTRPAPHLDDKMVAAWNGLMISGYAIGGQALKSQDFIKRAERAAAFMKKFMYNSQEGTLLRTAYCGTDAVEQIPTPIEAFIDDYAFVIRGLLDLYECCYDESLIKWAYELQLKQNQLFWDEEGGGYFSSRTGDTSIVMRMKDDQDGAEPSGNSVSVSNLLRLSSVLDKPDLQQVAERILKVFKERLEKIPIAVPEMLCGLMMHASSCHQIIILGDPDSEDTRALLHTVQEEFLPYKNLIVLTGKESFLMSHNELLKNLSKKDGKATAFVCKNRQCSLPVNNTEELKKLL